MPSTRRKESLTSIDQQAARRRKRQEKESTAHATVPPPSISVDDLTKPIDSSMTGIVDVTRVLSGDSQVQGSHFCVSNSSLTCAGVRENERSRQMNMWICMYCCQRPARLYSYYETANDDNPTVCIAPKTKTSIRSFSQLSRAFQTQCSASAIFLGDTTDGTFIS